MEFETLKRSHLKRNIIIGVVVVGIISACILTFTRARYRTTQSIPLVNGTINYELSDLNLIGVYVEDGDDYTKVEEIPDSGYTFNSEKSYCKIGDEKQDMIITYDMNTKTLNIAPMTTKGTKCYLYFDIEVPTLFEQLLVDNPIRLTRTDFGEVLEEDNIKTLYVALGDQTEDGSTVYYFAGNALNNWVKFAGYYWRIIRTNEDGSIRMLYSGKTPDTTTGYINENNYDFNLVMNNPMYIGYMYGTSGSLASNRTNDNSSIAKSTIDSWYNNNINGKTDFSGNAYDLYVSKEAIYCNDRASNNAYGMNNTFYFASVLRIQQYKPSYKCGNSLGGTQFSDANVADKFSASNKGGGNGDLSYPVALMTADEVMFAGGMFNRSALPWYYYNSNKESITGTAYWWTMSPYYFDYKNNSAVITAVETGIYPGRLSPVSGKCGLRPVVSLKSCIYWIGGDGSSSNPYEVSVDSACAVAEN